MNKVIILSDIHANLSALKAVIADAQLNYNFNKIILLGDNINYGMRPNEVIQELITLESKYSIICNLQGNHENALFSGQLEKFSSDRGRKMLSYTRDKLSSFSINYIQEKMEQRGEVEIEISGKKLLCIHGEIDDPFWGKLTFDKIKKNRYSKYDYIISGHTHIPHHIEYFFEVCNPDMRDKKRVVFLNPGSVGQPRNHNPLAQYLFIDFDKEIIHKNAVFYNIAEEQALYTDKDFEFYKNRIIKGI